MIDATARLTPKQKEVMRMLMRNLRNAEIASSLGVSEATVKAHVSAILEKFECKSRREAVRQCQMEPSSRADS